MADEDTAPGEAADAADAAEPTGAIEQLAANAWGLAVMWARLVACTGLSLWQLSEAQLSEATAPRPPPARGPAARQTHQLNRLELMAPGGAGT